jgi:hypothetical protein
MEPAPSTPARRQWRPISPPPVVGTRRRALFHAPRPEHGLPIAPRFARGRSNTENCSAAFTVWGSASGDHDALWKSCGADVT